MLEVRICLTPSYILVSSHNLNTGQLDQKWKRLKIKTLLIWLETKVRNQAPWLGST